jgi:hypothetical protein
MKGRSGFLKKRTKKTKTDQLLSDIITIMAGGLNKISDASTMS